MGALASGVIREGGLAFREPPHVVVLTLLVELCHLRRKGTFLHHQKTIKFLSQLTQQYVLVLILKFDSYVRKK